MINLLKLRACRTVLFAPVDDIADQGGAQVDDQDVQDDDPTTVDVDQDDTDIAQDSKDAAEEEIVVSIGEPDQTQEDDHARAPDWLRDLRKANREKDRRIRDLEAKLSQNTAPPAAVVVGEKPTLEGCDYDGEKFASEIEIWHERKLKADDAKRRQDDVIAKEQERWQSRLDAVAKAAASLKVADPEEADAVFQDTFSIVQQGIVLGGPDDPKTAALVRYALGKNPKKAKELAGITEPVKFAFAIADLVAKMKVTPRKSAPPPESRLTSSVAGAAAVDGQLERLRKKAEETGDYTKVMEFKSQLRKKQSA